jgi:hypothetical protein
VYHAGEYGQARKEAGMPRKIVQLTSRDRKVIAYDDRSKRFFLAKLEPLDLTTLEKDEIIEAAERLLSGDEPDAVIR